MLNRPPKSQEGVFLLEALIAILIFSLGILTMLALQGTAINAQSDAVYRTEAANLVNGVIGQINLSVNRSGAISLANYDHQSTGSCTAGSCTFSGAASTDPVVTNFSTAAQRLPGATSSMQQIIVGAANNSITVTVAWRISPNAPYRWHKVTAYVY